MPSLSLLHWQNERLPRLMALDTHCGAAATLVPPNPHLAEESLRSYPMLLSGHFQGFCRDLYAECTQIFTNSMPAAAQATIQAQFTCEMQLDLKNPIKENIRKDFERFAFTLNFAADPANALRETHLGQLNKWRNAVAHQKVSAPTGVPPLTLAAVQVWRTSCDGLAVWLDSIMHHELSRILGAAPW
jgi:hypothetical protein